MANIPLNKFKLVAKKLVSGDNTIYQETVKDLTAIVLSAQVSNVSGSTQQLTVKIEKDNNGTPELVTLLASASIPINDALNPLTGKLVLEKTDKLIFNASANNALEAVLSVLENANE
jgi:hypothetical protein